MKIYRTASLLRPPSLLWMAPLLPVIRSLKPPCQQRGACLPLSPTQGQRLLPSFQPRRLTWNRQRLLSEKVSPLLPHDLLLPHLGLPSFQITSCPTSAMGTLIRWPCWGERCLFLRWESHEKCTDSLPVWGRLQFFNMFWNRFQPPGALIPHCSLFCVY